MLLQYPLLFPFGEDGWHKYLENKLTPGDGRKRTKMTMKDFFSYRLQQREKEGKILLIEGRLLQQFIVDAYATLEEDRLHWTRNNQATLRAELYRGL